MKKENQEVVETDTMKRHYDFDYSKAHWGKTAKRLAKDGYPVMVMLRPEVAEVFGDSKSVNDALQSLIDVAKNANTSNGRRKRRAVAV